MAATSIHKVLDRREILIDDGAQRRVFHHAQGHGSVIERLGLSCALEGHRGCVNCIEWNSDGSLLASGSDDVSVMIWDPYRRQSVATMPTGHTGNIFSVKFVPFSGDCMILSGAEDREVRQHDLKSCETVKVWSCSPSRVKRLAVSPHSPFLCWSAAEDGCVRQLDIREPHSCPEEGCRNVLIDLKLTCGAVSGATQCKCIAINPTRPEQIAVGAMDPYVRIYDARVCSLRRSAKQVVQYGDPSCLGHFAPGHISNPHSRKFSKPYNTSLATTYLTFSPDGRELLVNLSGEHVYLYNALHYQEALRYDFIERDDESDTPDTIVSCHHTSYCTWNGVRRPEDMAVCSRKLSKLSPSTAYHCVVSERVKRLKERGLEFHNAGKYLEAVREFSSAIRLCPTWHVLYTLRAAALYGRRWEGDMYAALRDTESALALSPSYQKSLRRRLRCLQHLNWNKAANHLLHRYSEQFPSDSDFIGRTKDDLELALKTESESKNGYRSDGKQNQSQWEKERQRNSFDYRTRFCGHCNTHTDIKEANFIGERGEYIAAGSDDGNIFIWEKASGNLVRVLHGDDSIVNCVQWHPSIPMLASSGIESVVRLWEPKPPGQKDTEVVREQVKVCMDNQKRMKVDPFEVMLMRMGFQVAVAQDMVQQVVQEHLNPEQHHHHQGERGREDEEDSSRQRGRRGRGRGGRGAEAGRGGGGGDDDGGDNDNQDGEQERGQVRWIEDPASCRQS